MRPNRRCIRANAYRLSTSPPSLCSNDGLSGVYLLNAGDVGEEVMISGVEKLIVRWDVGLNEEAQSRRIEARESAWIDQKRKAAPACWEAGVASQCRDQHGPRTRDVRGHVRSPAGRRSDPPTPKEKKNTLCRDYSRYFHRNHHLPPFFPFLAVFNFALACYNSLSLGLIINSTK